MFNLWIVLFGHLLINRCWRIAKKKNKLSKWGKEVAVFFFLFHYQTLNDFLFCVLKTRFAKESENIFIYIYINIQTASAFSLSLHSNVNSSFLCCVVENFYFLLLLLSRVLSFSFNRIGRLWSLLQVYFTYKWMVLKTL